MFYILIRVDCCLLDGTDVLYNKFNVDSSSPPDNPPHHPNTDYNCVVDTTDGQWKVARCDQEQHLVVCQSDYHIQPGTTTSCLHQGIVHTVVILFVINHTGQFLALVTISPVPERNPGCNWLTRKMTRMVPDTDIGINEQLKSQRRASDAVL